MRDEVNGRARSGGRVGPRQVRRSGTLAVAAGALTLAAGIAVATPATAAPPATPHAPQVAAAGGLLAGLRAALPPLTVTKPTVDIEQIATLRKKQAQVVYLEKAANYPETNPSEAIKMQHRAAALRGQIDAMPRTMQTRLTPTGEALISTASILAASSAIAGLGTILILDKDGYFPSLSGHLN